MVVKTDKIPLLKKKDILIVPIHDELNDLHIQSLENSILDRVTRSDINGVIIDVSSLEAMDLFTAKRLTHLTDMARLMDVCTTIVGMRPAVALTLTDMEISFPGVLTALTLDHGFSTIKENKKKKKKKKKKS